MDEAYSPPRIRSLTFSGDAAMPSVSTDGRTIAFMSGRDGIARIWLKQMVGGEAPLTEGQDIYPDFSPDGSAVAFMRFERTPGPPTIYRKPVIGGQARPVIEFGGQPAWSPDGEEIAFLRRFPDGTNVVMVVPAAGGDATELYRGERQLDELRWSASGQLALLGRSIGLSDKVLILDRDSRAVQELSLAAQNEMVRGLDWGPNGELVFVTAPPARAAPGLLQSYDVDTKTRRPIAWIEGGSELFQLDVSGSSVVFDLIASFQTLSEVSPDGSSRSLTRGPTLDRQPVVSPNGQHLLFSSHRSGAMDLWLRERGSGVLTQVTFDGASDQDPAFTADGTGILWSSDRDRGGVLEIWTVQLDGTGARRLSNDGVDAQNPSTWPGGGWIVYATNNAEHPGVWKMRADGSEPVPLEGAKGGIIPEASPNGRWVAFVVLNMERGVKYIRVADLESGNLTAFEIPVSAPRPGPGAGSLGRSRWSPDGSTLYFLGQNEVGDNGLYRQEFHPTRDTSDTREEVLSSEGGVRILETFDLTLDGGFVLSHLTPSSVIKIAEGVFGPSEER